MNVNELIQQLSELSDEQKKLRVCVQDGMDPSDSEEAQLIEIRPHWCDRIDCVHIIS